MNISKAKLEDVSIINPYLKNMEMPELDVASFNLEVRNVYIVKTRRKIVAFICYLILMENVELEAVYVDLPFRQHGYGNKLVEYMINEAYKHNCNSIFLEVRKTNVEAIRLYQSNGFKIINYRNQYYGSEDGLVMKRELRCKDE